MVKNKIIKAIQVLKELLKRQNIRVDKIILFGSQFRNNATAESDIDLAVISPDFEDKDAFERAEMLSDIQWKLTRRVMMPFDIIALSPSEWKVKDSLLSSFIRGGKVVAGI